ncbi:MAG: sensor histidine kinase [Eubacteriales bacterium]|nr:sensor histidine kinase [Eubacteriales bacterium]
MKKKSSLYTILLVSFIASFMLMLIFLFLMLNPRMSNLMHVNAVDRIEETVKQSVAGFSRYTNDLLGKMQYAVSILPDKKTEDVSWQDTLKVLKYSSPEIINIAVFNETGGLIFSADGDLRKPISHVEHENWFKKTIEREGSSAFFSKPHVQSIFDSRYSHVITLSQAFRYGKGGSTHLGVIMFDVDYGKFNQLINNTSLGKSGYTFVIDENDSIVLHRFKSELDLKLIEEKLSPIADTILGTKSAEQNGRECVYIIQSLEQTRWRMVGLAYVDEISQMQSSFKRLFIIALISTASIAMSMAVFLSVQITKPLSDFEKTIMQVQQGDMNARMKEPIFREMQLVSDSFDAMLSRIRELLTLIVQEQETKRLHELNALQAQINPHFLYNTLDSIIWMQERGNTKESIEMVSALARLFRISISKGKHEITVREELEHVRNYLLIQKLRFKNKFDYQIHFKPETLELTTIKLILQPLAENSLNHAIDEYGDEQLSIIISSEIENDCLLFTVYDNGVGIPEEKLKNLLSDKTKNSGIGLKNVHERIQLSYGKEYGLVIESKEDYGTKIYIRIPIKRGLPDEKK